MGMAHCGQSFVVTGGAGFGSHLLTERTSKKTANATIMKFITVLRNIP